MVTPTYAQNIQKSYKIATHHAATALPKVTQNELKCGKNEDPAKITFSKMAGFGGPCCPYEGSRHGQGQAVGVRGFLNFFAARQPTYKTRAKTAPCHAHSALSRSAFAAQHLR